MTSTEDFFIHPSEQLSNFLTGSSTVDFPLEEPEVFAALKLGVCSSPPPPQSSFVVPCPLSVELSLSPLPVLDEVDESSALSTAAAIAATGSTPSFSAAVAPPALSIQLPTAWPEVPRESRHPPVVTPRSPDSTRTSLRKKRPTKKALAAAAANTTKSTLTARLMSSNTAPPALLKQEEEQCGTTEIVAGQQPPQPHPMVAQPPVAQQPPPPPLSSSSSVASNPPPPTTHHHIHHQQQQQPSHNKAPPPPVQENTGRWTAEEHRLFLQGLEQHGKGWKKIASLIKSRTVVQIRTHAQKYFQKLAKARQNGEQVGGVMDGSGAGGGNGNHGQVTMATRDEGTSTSSYPQVTMRTISHHAGNGGNMSIGSDPTSLAAAAGHVGIADSGALGGRKRRAGSNPGGSTKRRAIGSVVRSSVREGRNAKRQTKAARKRKSKQQAELDGQNYVEDGAEEVDVPNPLPAISQVLDPYMPLPPPPGTLTANGPNTTGRNQLVNTATHNTLPMAALEDAVFRLLTPATGAPVPPVPTAQNINDPLAPNTVKPPQGPSPVGVDQQLYPSWVDAKNPPAWYSDGGDIETLLEDADCLNWLNDTGDLEETYPPAVVEPSPVTSGDGANAAGSHESLSFLVDPPNQEGATTDDAATADSGTVSVNPTTTITAEADSKPAAVSTTTTTEEYSSATEAMAAVQQKQEAAVKEEPLFPDLDVGDDQEFVSALLENQGQSHLSFSKLHSELHAGDEQQQ